MQGIHFFVFASCEPLKLNLEKILCVESLEMVPSTLIHQKQKKKFSVTLTRDC